MSAAFDAMVVGHVDVGESGRIVRFLSLEEGRISLVTHAARGKWRGLLEVGTRLAVTARPGRGDLRVIGDLTWISGPVRARSDLGRLALLLYGCELCWLLAHEREPAPKAHGLLVAWLALLEGDHAPGGGARLALESKVLTFAGFTPALLRCARCGDPADEPMRFAPAAGGAVHARCGAGEPVGAAWLVHVAHLRRTPLAELASDPGPGHEGWLADLIESSFGQRVKSRALLDDLASGGGGL